MRRSARLELMRSAFKNWWLPGYLGSIAYRIRRISPSLFERVMDWRMVVVTRAGPSLTVRLRDVNGPAEVFGAGEYADTSIDWSQVRYVLDAGAHVGGFALWIASRSPDCRIVCLEPNPKVRNLLEMNVEHEHLAGRVIVHPWALAASRGAGWLHAESDSAASSLVVESEPGDVRVETATLRDAISASAFPRIDVMKIDIEGAEHGVFAGIDGTDLDLVGICIVECHRGSDDIAAALRSARFDVHTVTKSPELQLLTARHSGARTPAG
jgi:FkbM family methyltransferase